MSGQDELFSEFPKEETPNKHKGREILPVKVKQVEFSLIHEPGYDLVPSCIASAGDKASYRFLEFFAAQIRNKNTRRAYYRNALHFFSWSDHRNLEIDQITSMHVAAYVEEISQDLSSPSVKQNLATIRMLFDYLVIGQIVPINPAAAVRGPKHVVKKGKTPVLSEEEAKDLLASIDCFTVVGLRDRALIGIMLYTFGRVEAVLGMDCDQYYIEGRRGWVRLHEKGNKIVTMPCHHKLEEFLDAYLEKAGFSERPKKVPLFQTVRGRSCKFTGNRMKQCDAWRMIRRRAKTVGIMSLIGNHSFRATGITNYLQNGGKIETAQQMAGHESSRTTGLYDRRSDELSLDEIERISI